MLNHAGTFNAMLKYPMLGLKIQRFATQSN